MKHETESFVNGQRQFDAKPPILHIPTCANNCSDSCPCPCHKTSDGERSEYGRDVHTQRRKARFELGGDGENLRIPRYSGPLRSGICVCGCSWDEHHLGIVMNLEYVEETKEAYIPGECCKFGFNETGGMKYNKETSRWEEHCQRYQDSMEKNCSDSCPCHKVAQKVDVSNGK